jgi:hypothetical protein
MQKHTKIYINHFGYTLADFIPCEICGGQATDIHHIEPKGMGGSKTKDYIENLIAVCRDDHNRCHDSKEFNETAKNIHLKVLKNNV